MSEKIRSFLNTAPPPNIPFWVNSSAKIFIYGTGSMAESIYRVLTENGFVISGFIDHRVPEHPFLKGLPILDLEKATDAMVIMGIHNRDAEIPPILEHLRSSGAARIITPVELYDFFSHELGNRYWLTKRDYYYSFKSIIEEVDAMWADEASQSLYASILEFRIKGDYSVLPPPDLTHQYFPLDIPAWQTPLRFVDCGAFDGDTLSAFISNKIEFDAVIAFEPDLVNFAKLSQFISTHKREIQDVTLLPCGVHSTTTQLTFESGQESASSISSLGKAVIQCVALDDAIPTFAPNLIKMDIEGAEYDALLGARQIIRAHAPGLAVSLYHRPEHLWQIPMLVESIAPGKYKFYMRSHAMNDFELVLYALPVEQKN